MGHQRLAHHLPACRWHDDGRSADHPQTLKMRRPLPSAVCTPRAGRQSASEPAWRRCRGQSSCPSPLTCLPFGPPQLKRRVVLVECQDRRGTALATALAKAITDQAQRLNWITSQIDRSKSPDQSGRTSDSGAGRETRRCDGSSWPGH